MRKQYWPWMVLVFGIVGTAYGTHLLIYHYNHGKFSLPALVLLIFGGIALILMIIYLILMYLAKKHHHDIPPTLEEEPVKEEPIKEEPVIEEPIKEEPQNDEAPKEETPEPEIEDKEDEDYYEEPSPRPSRYQSYSTVYVKLVGYGPILRIEGPRIIDMRSNTYYHIDGGFVYQDGYGLRYVIRGNQIKDAFGGFLYELSGSNINKVFGGFYASISGSYITLYDLSDKYEMTGSLSKLQILAVAALLFGKY